MDLRDYLSFAETTWVEKPDHNTEFALAAMGLAGEAGETVEIIKKSIRDNKDVDPEKLSKELGDVLYYWVTICRLYGLDPQEVLEGNVSKLRDRFKRDAIKGEGDDR